MAERRLVGMNTASPEPLTVRDLIATRAARDSEALALLAPGRKPLSYGGLLAQMHYVLEELRANGIGIKNRVALVMPNGPEMAACFLGVAAASTCAPLNPNYTGNELRFYLSDLRATTLITSDGLDSPARGVAQDLGMAILELELVTGAEAGVFKFNTRKHADRLSEGLAGPNDVALVLHSSGTTSRPKIVPFTQRKLCSLAQFTRDSLQLGASDRCLNVMPFFHVQGLVMGVWASIAQGGSVICPPGFEAQRFFEWIDELKPTWYTGVPTIHQAILARAQDHREIIERRPLRLIHSTSSLLPPDVTAELERVFQVPVAETYGATETYIISRNPPFPGRRKPGSVGLPTICRVAIMGEHGSVLPPGQTGEVVVQGETVISCYDDNPEANESAFTEGWFRTGDQGYVDDDGCLYLTGRIKEIINRGGEKISPREVDEVLLSHPDVAQAVTFAVAHPQLGEEVAAAVVPQPGASPEEEELRRFAAERLAHFKVPRRVLLLGELPKGPTGKLQRIGLAEKLGLCHEDLAPAASTGADVAPRTDLEEVLAGIWAEVLGLERVGAEDDFFLAGGNSMLAAGLVARIEESLGIRLPLAMVFMAPTLRGLAEVIANRNLSEEWPALVPIKPSGSRPPLFCINVQENQVFFSYDLARCMDSDQPVYGFQGVGLDERDDPPGTLEDLARGFVAKLVGFLPEGPYFLGGYCVGGVVAFEMARQLEAMGRKVALLALFETNATRYSPKLLPQLSTFVRVTGRALDRLSGLSPFAHFASPFGFRQRLDQPAARMPRLLKEVFSASFQADGTLVPGSPWPQDNRLWNLLAAYEPQVYAGGAILFRPTWAPLGYVSDPKRGWGRLVAGGLEVVEVPAYHRTVTFGPRNGILAARLQESIQMA